MIEVLTKLSIYIQRHSTVTIDAVNLFFAK